MCMCVYMRVVTTKTNTWWNFYFYYLEWFLCKLNLFVRSSQAIIHWSYIAYPFDQINFRKSMLAFIGVKRHELFINDPDWAITNHPQNQKKICSLMSWNSSYVCKVSAVHTFHVKWSTCHAAVAHIAIESEIFVTYTNIPRLNPICLWISRHRSA